MRDATKYQKIQIGDNRNAWSARQLQRVLGVTPNEGCGLPDEVACEPTDNEAPHRSDPKNRRERFGDNGIRETQKES